MKKQIIFIVFCLSFLITCSQSNGNESELPTGKESKQGESDLIVTSAVLDFSKHKATFIEIGADRCIPCKAMQPIMREIAAEYRGIIQVVFYDVWKYPKFGEQYGVRLIPTQVFMDAKGREVYRHTGIFPKEDIIAMLKEKKIL
jgi:thioredoxin 1